MKKTNPNLILEEIDQLVLEFLEQGGNATLGKQKLESLANFLKDVIKETPNNNHLN